jgi:uncharacterized protein (TIGR01777 family)
MNIALTGASGFIARHLVPKLRQAGRDVRALGRRPFGSLPFYQWDSSKEPAQGALESCDAVIHLAGETVAQRWTAESKRRIRTSRVEGTRNLVAALSKLAKKPSVLLAASAVGIYGSRGDELLTETSAAGSGFLAGLSKEWETEARAAESFGVRVVNLRFGVILGREGGAFPKMAAPFRYGVGGRLGSGRQWTPWVHVDDAADLILFALDNTSVRGAVNVVAPNPVTNADFTKLLAAALHRPAFLTVPVFTLKLTLGQMSEAVVASLRVIPAAADSAGFRFKYPELEPALRELTGSPGLQYET